MIIIATINIFVLIGDYWSKITHNWHFFFSHSSDTFSRHNTQSFLTFFFIFAAVLPSLLLLESSTYRARARYKATSKIAAWRSTTKPQGKANRPLPPFPSPWISNDRRAHVAAADTSVFQYRWRFEYTDQLVLDVPRRRHMRLSTWGEIDDRVDKWVPTAFLSVSLGCSSFMYDGWRSMCKIGKRRRLRR